MFFFFLKCPTKQDLREELIEKWTQYAEQNNLDSNLLDILAVDVGGKDRLKEFLWFSSPRAEFQKLQREILQLLRDRNFHDFFMSLLIHCFIFAFFILGSLISLFLWAPLSFLVFYQKGVLGFTKKKFNAAMLRGCIATSKGVFIYHRGFDELILPDQKYSPVLFLIRCTFSPVIEATTEKLIYCSLERVRVLEMKKNFRENFNMILCTDVSKEMWMASDFISVVQEAKQNFIQNNLNM
eukprot:snap_masked-scaffold_8-processed-gene-6.33-mRNA-1 protein AED:1.00 eAED:1.00 QI:0/0/0/0/1/1/2/0/238